MAWSDAARAAAAASRRAHKHGTPSGRKILAGHIKTARFHMSQAKKYGHGLKGNAHRIMAQKSMKSITGLRRHFHMSPIKGGY